MTSSQLDVLVIGGANTDYLIKGARLPGPGSTVQGREFQEAPGGKGANQAVAAARLGARVALLARVGSDERGRTIVAHLAAEHVDTAAVLTDPEAPTGVALVMVDDRGEKQIAAVLGANQKLAIADLNSAGGRLESTTVLLLQLEVPIETVSEAVRRARAAGARIVLDPAPPAPLEKELLEMVHVLRPNANEAEVLTGIEVRDFTSARKAAEVLLQQGVEAVCIGAPEGNLLLSSEGELHLQHVPLNAVDATGAGDAFAGALATCLTQGQRLPEAVRFAHAAAALATTKLGAQAGLPRAEEVRALLGRTREAGPRPDAKPPDPAAPASARHSFRGLR